MRSEGRTGRRAPTGWTSSTLTSRAWTCVSPLPQPRIGAGAAVSDADTIGSGQPPDIYAVGGLDGRKITSTMYSAPSALDATDVTPPVVISGPSPRIPVGIRAGTTTFPVAIRWSRTDAGTDILADHLQASGDGTTWTDVSVPFAVLDPAYFNLGSIRWLQYRVDPTDCDGNTDAAPTSGMAFATHLHSERAATYRGRWSLASSSKAQGGRYGYSTEKGAVARFSFTGSEVAWLAAEGPTRGQANVAIDGHRVATVNLHARGSEPRMVVFQRRFATSGAHTLTITVVGTAGHPSVNIDSLFVIGDPASALAPKAHLRLPWRYTHARAARQRRVRLFRPTA